MRLRTILGILVLVLVVSWPAPSRAEINLTFGVYTSDKPSSMVRQFRPVLNALEAQMRELSGKDVRIKLRIASTYQHGLIDLISGKVDFARFGPSSYIRAKELNPGIDILVIENDEGNEVFQGIIAVKVDNSIQSATELRGKSLAFGDYESTTGRYLAQLYLIKNGIRADDLSRFDYLGQHDAVGLAVAAGRFDAGALEDTTFNALVREGAPLRAIASFPGIPKPWLASSELPKGTKKLLREALLRAADNAALTRLVKGGFVTGDDRDYAAMREVMMNNNLFFRKSIAEKQQHAK